MLIKATDPGACKARVYDEYGKVVEYVVSYDTVTYETEVVETYLAGDKVRFYVGPDGNLVTKKVILPNSRLGYVR